MNIPTSTFSITLIFLTEVLSRVRTRYITMGFKRKSLTTFYCGDCTGRTEILLSSLVNQMKKNLKTKQLFMGGCPRPASGSLVLPLLSAGGEVGSGAGMGR